MTDKPKPAEPPVSETPARPRGNCICDAGYASTCPVHTAPRTTPAPDARERARQFIQRKTNFHSNWPFQSYQYDVPSFDMLVDCLAAFSSQELARLDEFRVAAETEVDLLEREVAKAREELSASHWREGLAKKQIHKLNQEVAEFRADCIRITEENGQLREAEAELSVLRELLQEYSMLSLDAGEYGHELGKRAERLLSGERLKELETNRGTSQKGGAN